MKITALALLSVLITSPVLNADELEDAAHAMRAGDYAEAYCILKPLAQAGDAEAQFNLGWMYSNGYGLAINNSLALEWWRRASEQNLNDASFAIAMLYNHGEGEVERDSEKALEYFLLAAEAGHEDAILIIRSMLIRDDRAIRKNSKSLINDYAEMFGPMLQVRVKKVNVRRLPNLESKIVLQLEQGALVVELNRKDGWSQVGVVGDGRIAWIYSKLLEAKPEQPVEADVLSVMVEDEQQETDEAGQELVDPVEDEL
jgi:TPR repeat protein